MCNGGGRGQGQAEVGKGGRRSSSSSSNNRRRRKRWTRQEGCDDQQPARNTHQATNYTKLSITKKGQDPQRRGEKRRGWTRKGEMRDGRWQTASREQGIPRQQFERAGWWTGGLVGYLGTQTQQRVERQGGKETMRAIICCLLLLQAGAMVTVTVTMALLRIRTRLPYYPYSSVQTVLFVSFVLAKLILLSLPIMFSP